MRRRRGSGPALVTILWRDIPAQVSATTADATEKALLPNRFQVAIDRAAKVAGKTELHAYVAEWRRIEQPLDGDPAAAVTERITEIDRTYTRDRLAALVRQGGVEADQETAAGRRGRDE